MELKRHLRRMARLEGAIAPSRKTWLVVINPDSDGAAELEQFKREHPQARETDKFYLVNTGIPLREITD